MYPKANLNIREIGFAPSDVPVRKRSHPTVAFGCAAHIKKDDSGVSRGRCGVTGGGASIATPKALLCRQLQTDEEETTTSIPTKVIGEAVPQLRENTQLGLDSQKQQSVPLEKKKKSMLWKGFGSDWSQQSCMTQRCSSQAVQRSWLKAGKAAPHKCSKSPRVYFFYLLCPSHSSVCLPQRVPRQIPDWKTLPNSQTLPRETCLGGFYLTQAWLLCVSSVQDITQHPEKDYKCLIY